MQSIALPKSPRYEEIDKNTGRFVIEGCFPGYGTTIGNSLRRTMLSSLAGNAAVAVKIKGASHEFTTIKGVKEDVVQIILNLKKVRFRLNDVDEATIFLKMKGEKEVTAKDFKTTSEIEVVTPEAPVATLTAPSSLLELEVKVERGLGYIPVEQQEREEKEIGTIAIDAVYNPVKRVNFNIDNMRVGKRTDFDRITLEVVTDGSITPEEAYAQSVEILMSQFNAISNIEDETEEIVEEKKEVKTKAKKGQPKKEAPEDTPAKDLNLSARTFNVLEANDVFGVSQIEKMTEEDLRELEGLGDKGIKEIKKAIGSLGITLKSE